MNKINILCPINGTGYGITSKNIVMGLDSLGYEISLFPIGNQIAVDSEIERNVVQKALNNSASYDPSAQCLKIWHQYDLASRIGYGKYYVFPFFEVDKLTPKEIHNINSADAVFTASKWGKTILEDNGITKPITVAPLGVNLDIFKEPNRIKIEQENYVFFHIGKWEKRKSHDVLIEAFNRAFTEKDNVELRLLPHNPFLNKEEEQYWHGLVLNSKLKDKIKVYGRLKTHYDLADFIFHGDCGVYLSRAEGWNNEIPETMAMNKPVIATNYSAHTEYCTSDNSYLVEIDELESANDGKWFNGFGNWAKVGEKQIEQTIEYMRYVYKNNIKTNQNGLDTAQQYSWNNTSSIISQTLKKKRTNAPTNKKSGRKQTKVSN